MLAPLSGRHGTWLAGQAEQVFLYGSVQCWPAGQQTPLQLRSLGQHWPLTQTSAPPGLQHFPPQTGAVNWQQRLFLASAQVAS